VEYGASVGDTRFACDKIIEQEPVKLEQKPVKSLCCVSLASKRGKLECFSRQRTGAAEQFERRFA